MTNPLSQLTPEQRAALLAMPQPLATRILAGMPTDPAPGAFPDQRVQWPGWKPFNAPHLGSAERRPVPEHDYLSMGALVGFTNDDEKWTTPRPPSDVSPGEPGMLPNTNTGLDVLDPRYVPDHRHMGAGHYQDPQAPTFPKVPGRELPGMVPPPNDRFNPDLADPRGMFDMEDARLRPGSSFIPGAEYQTADLAGLTPSGVSQEAMINNAAMSYRTLMAELDEYEKTFAEFGGRVLPGKGKDTLDTQRRNIQMQMKELYNLGVLNGPDLMLMDEILLDPTGIGANILDRTGLVDLDSRITGNIQNVRDMMTRLVEPRLKMIGKTPADVLPPREASEMSDDDLLKALGLN